MFVLFNQIEYGWTKLRSKLDQAQIEAARHQYPPQPEVEFGFPKECYCGGEPLLTQELTRGEGSTPARTNRTEIAMSTSGGTSRLQRRSKPLVHK